MIVNGVRYFIWIATLEKMNFMKTNHRHIDPGDYQWIKIRQKMNCEMHPSGVSELQSQYITGLESKIKKQQAELEGRSLANARLEDRLNEVKDELRKERDANADLISENVSLWRRNTYLYSVVENLLGLAREERTSSTHQDD